MMSRRSGKWSVSLGWSRADEAWRLALAKSGRGGGSFFVLFSERKEAEVWYGEIDGDRDVERLLDQVEIREEE